MLATSFHFKNERLDEIYRLLGATFYYCINIISQFIKPFLGNIFEEYVPFKILCMGYANPDRSNICDATKIFH